METGLAKHALEMSVVQLLSYKHINEKRSRLSGVSLSMLKKKNVKELFSTENSQLHFSFNNTTDL